MNAMIKEMHRKSEEAENNFRNWLRKQPEAIAEAKELAETSNQIKNPKNRSKFMKREKSRFDTKWTTIYSNR
jgi:chromatin segregation and condensation protein Rec8/ScpA/Scc1 (kleisin family)